MNNIFSVRKTFLGAVLLFSLFSAPSAWGQASSTLIGALFGMSYVTAFDSREVDFYYGQLFYDNTPGGYSTFDTYSTTFGSDITLYNQDFFNWFVGTERLGRTGSGSVNQAGKQYNLQWNNPVCGLYTGTRFDWNEKNLFEPYFFCIGGVYSISDLLGNSILISNGSSYNINATTLGLELGLGFTPIKFKSLEISIEGNYRWANFPNVSYSPSSSSLPPLPTGLPTGMDYSGWSVQIALSFEPNKPTTDNGAVHKEAARQKLLAGNIPYNKDSFFNAAQNCDTYIVNLFLESGFRLSDEDLAILANDPKVCDEVKAMVKPQGDKQAKPESNKTL